uniref:Charged multivesicular body protein 3 n=1 Tax=Steinernema glaseri TaxID=37863 RepID=A0A1I7ZRG5_9BILA
MTQRRVSRRAMFSFDSAIPVGAGAFATSSPPLIDSPMNQRRKPKPLLRIMGIFGIGKKPDPKEAVREMQKKMRVEMRQLDRQIHGIEREEQKVRKQIKDAAKKGDRDVCVVLAKSIVQSRKAVSKIHVSKAQINSVIMGMQQQLSTMRMAGSIQQSTEVMKAMQNLVKVPEIMKTMREMSQEMTKIGIIDEMIEDTMEMMEPDELEEEAQQEVDKVLWEITAGELGKAPHITAGELGKAPHAIADTIVDDQEREAEAAVNFADMKDRLEQLRS